MFGRIIPAPLLMPVMVTDPAGDLEAPRGGLGDRVGGHDGVRGGVPVVSARRSATQRGRPASSRSTGKGSRMTPVEKGSTCRSSMPSKWRWRHRCHRRLPALLAGAGIGDAGIDHQRADVAAEFQMPTADLYRCGAKAVGW
jgi:hypothetical protein